MLVDQSTPTLCQPVDCSPPGSSVHAILQAKIVEWVALPFSRGSPWPKDQTQVSRIAGRLFTIWATKEAAKIFFWPGLGMLDSAFPDQGSNPQLLQCEHPWATREVVGTAATSLTIYILMCYWSNSHVLKDKTNAHTMVVSKDERIQPASQNT